MADPNRRLFGQKASVKIFDNSSGKCFLCFKKISWAAFEKGDRGAWHVDHLKPWANGGMTTIKNGRVACRSCNSKKSDMTHVKFIKKQGGKGGISNFVRCHAILKNGQPCSSKAQNTSRQTLYCKRHSSATAPAPSKNPRAAAKKTPKKPKNHPTVRKSTTTKKPKNRTTIKKTTTPKKSPAKKPRTGKKASRFKK